MFASLPLRIIFLPTGLTPSASWVSSFTQCFGLSVSPIHYLSSYLETQFMLWESQCCRSKAKLCLGVTAVSLHSSHPLPLDHRPPPQPPAPPHHLAGSQCDVKEFEGWITTTYWAPYRQVLFILFNEFSEEKDKPIIWGECYFCYLSVSHLNWCYSESI